MEKTGKDATPTRPKRRNIRVASFLSQVTPSGLHAPPFKTRCLPCSLSHFTTLFVASMANYVSIDHSASFKGEAPWVQATSLAEWHLPAPGKHTATVILIHVSTVVLFTP